MNNNILVDLKNHVHLKKTNKNYTIGTVTLIIYSNELFKNNKEIIPFLKGVFNESYLPYVIKSRTLIVAKLGRYIAQKEISEIREINEAILNYFEDIKSDDGEIKKKTKKKNANDKLDSWLKGI